MADPRYSRGRVGEEVRLSIICHNFLLKTAWKWKQKWTERINLPVLFTSTTLWHTGWAPLILSHSSARISFELNGNWINHVWINHVWIKDVRINRARLIWGISDHHHTWILSRFTKSVKILNWEGIAHSSWLWIVLLNVFNYNKIKLLFDITCLVERCKYHLWWQTAWNYNACSWQECDVMLDNEWVMMSWLLLHWEAIPSVKSCVVIKDFLVELTKLTSSSL